MRITNEQLNEIFSKIMGNKAVAPENSATLRFNAESLKENFNAKLMSLLETSLTDDELAMQKKFLLIDDCKVLSDGTLDLFVNKFGDGAGLFGVSTTGGNFKILSLCFTVPTGHREKQTFKFVFGAFTKTFLPALVDPNELLDTLKENYSCAAGDVIFSLVQSGNLRLIHAVAASVRN